MDAAEAVLRAQIPKTCEHSEHARRGDGRYGRIVPVFPSFDWSQWEPCSDHVHEWRVLTKWAYREFRLCACGAHGIVRTHAYGVAIPDDSKEQT